MGVPKRISFFSVESLHMAAADVESARWESVHKMCRRASPLAGPGFEPDTTANPALLQFLREKSRVLVIGAGGLGCELLKDLALSGFRNIDVIDMDTIDVSNLNRQFLFRGPDVGKYKAEVAAAFVNKRVRGANVVAQNCKIQDKDDDFYRQFQMVICGLDSIAARRWMNSTLCGLVEEDDDGNIDPDTIIPMIDGGTEGFRGQARVIIPRMSSCFECSIDAFPPQKTFPLCTLAATPRIPEHCIQWASIVAWSEKKPFGLDAKDQSKPLAIDKDDPAHMQWLFERAKERAEANNIKGVTYKLTQGVIRNIIPAIASSNAIIAAACVNEALKVATNIAANLDNYLMYMADNGLYAHTFNYEKKENCASCGSATFTVQVNPETTLQELRRHLKEYPDLQLGTPSLRAGGM